MKVENKKTGWCAGQLVVSFSIPYNLKRLLAPIALIAVIAAALGAFYGLLYGLKWLFESIIIPARDAVVYNIGPFGTVLVIAGILAIIYKIKEEKWKKEMLIAVLVVTGLLLFVFFFAQTPDPEQIKYFY